MISWVRVRQLSAKEQNPVSTADREGSRGWTGLEEVCAISSPQRSSAHTDEPWSARQVAMEGELERSTGRNKVGEEEKSSEFRTDVRKCFFPSETAQHVEWSWQYCWCNAAGPAPGALRCGGGKKEQRVSKGWVSMACWRYCPVLSYLKCSEMCFELSFDISLQLQKENGEGTWSPFVACPEEKMILLLSAFLDCIELIGFVMWLCKHQSTGGFACAPVAIGRWVVSCHSYVERTTSRFLSCS